eukprot:15483109-Alexandrium_andersonii.AAC.1
MLAKAAGSARVGANCATVLAWCRACVAENRRAPSARIVACERAPCSAPVLKFVRRWSLVLCGTHE